MMGRESIERSHRDLFGASQYIDGKRHFTLAAANGYDRWTLLRRIILWLRAVEPQDGDGGMLVVDVVDTVRLIMCPVGRLG